MSNIPSHLSADFFSDLPEADDFDPQGRIRGTDRLGFLVTGATAGASLVKLGLGKLLHWKSGGSMQVIPVRLRPDDDRTERDVVPGVRFMNVAPAPGHVHGWQSGAVLSLRVAEHLMGRAQ